MVNILLIKYVFKKIKNSKIKILIVFFLIFFLIFVGTMSFSYLEGWSYVDSFYFSVISITTIGYGDLYPTHDISKIIISLYAILGVSLFLFSLGFVIEYYFYKRFNLISQKVSKSFKKKKR